MFGAMYACTYIQTYIFMYECMHIWICLHIYQSIHPSNHVSICPSVQPINHPSIYAEDLRPQSYPSRTAGTTAHSTKELTFTRLLELVQKFRIPKDSSLTSLLQLLHQDTVPRELVCHSWHYCLRYKGIEYNTFARDGTTDWSTKGLCLSPPL
jgi:hypothetical protein